MDSMDYQTEGSSIPNIHQTRRCPYAASRMNSNLFPGGTGHFPNHYGHYHNLPFVPPSPYFYQPLMWAAAPFPLLPPPTPSNQPSNHSTRYGLPLGDSARGSSNQPLLHNTNMAENAGDEANAGSSWNHEGRASNQSGPPGVERSITLPPLFGSDRTARFTQSSTTSNDLPRNATEAGYSGVSASRPPHFRDYQFHRHRREQSLASLAASSTSDEDPTPSELALQGDPWVEAYLDHHVPPLQNEETLRMDDPIRIENNAARLRIIRDMRDLMREERQQLKKTGASKVAIDSLVKVQIADLEEDDRICQICYNEYGVETPETAAELPIRMPKCKHTFGEICLKKWFEEKSTCPYCRDQLPSIEVHRARRNLSTSAFRHFSRDTIGSSPRQTTRHPGLRTPIRADWSEQILAANRAGATRDEMMLQQQARLADMAMAREMSRPYEVAVSSRSAPRRARGRTNNNRVSHHHDFGGMSDSQQMPMRVQVGEPGFYGSGRSNVGHRHNTRGGASSRSGLIPHGSSSHETDSPPTNSPHPYLLPSFPYTSLSTGQQNENFGNHDARSSREYSDFPARAYPSNYTPPRNHGHDFEVPFQSPYSEANWSPSNHANYYESQTNLQNIEASGERRTLYTFSQQDTHSGRDDSHLQGYQHDVPNRLQLDAMRTRINYSNGRVSEDLPRPLTSAAAEGEWWSSEGLDNPEWSRTS